MAVVVVCVVATGMSGMKAYNAANQSEADMLLSEHVEALSSGEGGSTRIKCYTSFEYEAGCAVVECSNCCILEDHDAAWYSDYDYC